MAAMAIKELAAAIGAEVIGDADPTRIVDGVAGADGASEQSERNYVAYWPTWMEAGLALQAIHCAALVVPTRWARERWARIQEKNLRLDAMRNVVFLGVPVRAESVDADLFAAQQRAAHALGVEAIEWRRPETVASAARGQKRHVRNTGTAMGGGSPSHEDRVAADVARGRLPTSTFLLCRLPIFSPAVQPVTRDGKTWFPTAWGKARVTGRLGQRHADVLAAIMARGAAARIPDGGVEIAVAAADLRRTARVSGGQLSRLLDELRSARVEVDVHSTAGRAGFTGDGQILDDRIRTVGAHPASANLKNHGDAGAVTLRFRLGRLFVALWREDFPLYQSTGELSELRGLTSGVSQAVVRFCSTHAKQPAGGWYVDTVLRVVTGEPQLSGQRLRDGRRALRRDAEALRGRFGIVIDGRRIRSESVEHRPEGTENVGHRPEGSP